MSAEKDPAGQGGVFDELAVEGAVSSVQTTGLGSGSATLAPEHVAELAASAIPLDVAAAAGVYTAYTTEALPAWGRWIGSKPGALPALVYPMREVDGTETGQVKPQPGSVTSKDSRDLKYVGPSKKSGNPPQLPLVGVRLADGSISTDPADLAAVETVWLVEGCKQALAALARAPRGVAVARFTGVHSWMVASGAGGESGTATPHLSGVVAGRKVIIIGDADAAANIAVYDGLAGLGVAATAAGAATVAFAWVPGTGTQGLDDVLAGLPDDDARRGALASWADAAKGAPADLSKAQQKKMRAARRAKLAQREAARKLAATADPARADIQLQGDHHLDCLSIADAVTSGLGGTALFLRGGVSCELVDSDDGQVLRVLDSDGLHRRTLSVVRLVVTTLKDDVEVTKVVPGLKREPLGILKGRMTERLPKVSRISRAPVVRPDGTIVTTPGYDPETGVLIDLAPDVQGLSVPAHPTDGDIAAAMHLLRDDLFEMDGVDGYDGWVFASEADRTHSIALLLTCLLRSAFPVVPLAVADGLQRGVGKGELVQVVHQIAYGTTATMMAAPASDVELEKRITALLMAGSSMIVLDEVMGDQGSSKLASTALTAVLTTPVWGGRLLGKSETLSLDQAAVWVATGNNVDIPGDMIRRVYLIRLASDRPGLDTRDNFRRDLRRWVPAHRAELLTAALTLIRAWYDRGQPEAPRPIGMSTFSEWQRVVGGILHLAGLEGFLSTVAAMRGQADSEAVENREHLAWVADTAARLPGAPRFTAKEIVAAAAADPDHAAPYDRVMDDLDPRGLGRVWKRMAGRWFGDLRIVEDGRAHGNVAAWRVQEQVTSTASPAPAPATPPPAPQPAPAPGPRPSAGSEPGEVIGYIDHRGNAQQAARAMPPMTGLTITELGGAS